MDIINFTDTYSSYLKDESKLVGSADSISFATSIEDVVAVVNNANGNNIPLTIQGGKTGLCGGAVPNGGHILNMERMDKVVGIREDGEDCILSLECGVSIDQLNNPKTLKLNLTEEELVLFDKFKKTNKHVFLPQPTETSALIGGIVACNAKGINQAFLADSRAYIEGLQVVLASGKVLNIARGQHHIVGGKCIVDGIIELDFAGESDNVTALQIKQDMDLIDLFIGTEGLFGVITKVDVRLKRDFDNLWGVLFFFRENNVAHNFVSDLNKLYNEDNFGCQLVAVEYYDQYTLRGMQSFKGKVAKLASVPDINEQYKQCIYVELAGEEEQLEQLLMTTLEAFVAYNDNEEDSWAAAGLLEVEKFRLLRHSAPEYVNQQVELAKLTDSSITKVALDYSAPQDKLEETLAIYDSIVTKHQLESYVFGHIYNNHLHVNIVARSGEQYQLAQAVAMDIAMQITALGGTVVSENGIGKIKKPLVSKLASSTMAVVKSIKSQLDCSNIINRGNIL